MISPMLSLTAPQAVNAARRLWRYALGETYTGKVVLTTGNRRTMYRNGVLYVNHTRGWPDLISELTWAFLCRANPDERLDRDLTLKLYKKMEREAIKRGWLKDDSDEADLLTYVSKADALATRQRKKLESIDRLLVLWGSKQQRAERAIAKLTKQRKYYAKVVQDENEARSR